MSAEKMKPIAVLCILLSFVLLFTACAGNAPAAPTQTPASEAGEPAETSVPETTEPVTTAQVDRRAFQVYEDHPELTPVDLGSPALLPISEDMGQEYLDRITFLCDSPTYWLWPYGMLKGGDDSTQLWTGPEGTMTLAYQGSYEIYDPFDKVERPIREVVELHKPDIMVIALGINGISFMDEEYFTAEYTDLVTSIQEISPDTILLLQSIYPITPAYRYWGDITNVMITEANSWILKIAEEHGCRYLDTFSCLVAQDGNAKEELMMSDGLHPNKDGLAEVLTYIRTHGYQEKN